MVKEFRQPAQQVRVLRGKFEEEVKKFKAAEQRVREMCRGKRQGGGGSKRRSVGSGTSCAAFLLRRVRDVRR